MSGAETEVWILPDGRVRYIGRGGLDLSGLGPKEVVRLSRIEWDGASRAWRVVDHGTGGLIGLFASREEALEFEYDYFRGRLGSLG